MKRALEVLAAGEREGVDEDVERVVARAPALEDARDVLVARDVARFHERRADRRGQRPDPLLDEALDRREADLRALVVQRLRDAPGDRMVVRDAEDERRLAVQQSHRSLLRGSDTLPSCPTVDPPSPSIPSSGASFAASRRSSSTPTACSILKGEPLPGAREALARLEARGTPYRVVTNFSTAHRSTLVARFAEHGGVDPAGGLDHHRVVRGGRPYRRALPGPAALRHRCAGRAPGVRWPAPGDPRGGRGRRPGTSPRWSSAMAATISRSGPRTPRSG